MSRRTKRRLKQSTKPARSQFGGCKQAASELRNLLQAADALEQTPSAVADGGECAAATGGAEDASGPTGSLQRRSAVGLSAQAANERGQRHAWLERDSVEGHLVRFVVEETKMARPVGQQTQMEGTRVRRCSLRA